MSVTPKQAIDVYVLLAKNAKNPAAAKTLIQQAINDNNTFVFGEILHLPVMKEIQNEKEYNLLKLFCFGTFMMYEANPGAYPALSEKNLLKLKKLTVISLSSKHKTLSYKMLMETLKITKTRDLEDMLIDCMYENLITGKLDQKEGYLEVTSAMNRDVKQEELPQIIDRLKKWVVHSEQLLLHMGDMAEMANKEFDVYEKKKKNHEEAVKKLEEHVKQFRVEDVEMMEKRNRRRRYQP